MTTADEFRVRNFDTSEDGYNALVKERDHWKRRAKALQTALLRLISEQELFDCDFCIHLNEPDDSPMCSNCHESYSWEFDQARFEESE
jgi:hypothetical protein